MNILQRYWILILLSTDHSQNTGINRTCWFIEAAERQFICKSALRFVGRRQQAVGLFDIELHIHVVSISLYFGFMAKLITNLDWCTMGTQLLYIYRSAGLDDESYAHSRCAGPYARDLHRGPGGPRAHTPKLGWVQLNGCATMHVILSTNWPCIWYNLISVS